MKKRIFKTIHFFLDLLFIAFVIIFGYIFFSAYQGKISNLFGYHFLRVVSSSMTPEIEEGECIIVKSIQSDKLEVGDIITFYSEDPYIYGYLNTHRIASIDLDENGNKLFHTKGDANSGEDVYPVKEERIIGKYCGELMFGKMITKGFSLLSNQKIYFIVIIIPILLCMVSSILSIIRIILEDETKKEQKNSGGGK